MSAAVADGAVDQAATGSEGFRVKLRNFEGPFDLLLHLISQQRLDVTEVALHQVTDDFIGYTKALGADMPLDQTTEFLVVAATLLDLKAARLLPSGEVDDLEDLAVLEARDLLFARLLQYRAFKHVAELFAEWEAAALRRYARAVALEDQFVGLLPEVTLGVDAAGFAAMAAAVFTPRPTPTVGLGHLHVPKVSVVEQAKLMLDMLRARGRGVWTTFAELSAECETIVQIIARFLALLELYREKILEFDQPDPLGPLAVAWTGENDDFRLNTSGDEDYE